MLRRIVAVVLAVFGSFAFPMAGSAQQYPSRTVTIIVPYPAGGPTDETARIVANFLSKKFGQNFIVENVTGGSTIIATGRVANAAPDGYTLLSHIVSISGFAAVDKLFGRQPKFTNADFIPICRVIADPIVLIVNKDVPYRTLKELVADAKANPNKVIYSSSGLYGASHIPTVLFAKAAGDLQMRHLPTNGGGPAVTAVLGGNVNFFMSPTSIALTQIRAGKVHPLAVSSAKRVKALPDVPTFRELGYNLEYYFWVGFFAPKGTPTPVINTLRDGFKKAAHSKQFVDTLENLGQELDYLDQPEFAKFWEIDAKRQEDAINSIGRVQG